MIRMLKILALELILLVLIVGCASQTYKVHPGAANTFDSQSYDALLVTHSVIEQTKSDLANNVFAGSLAAAVKTSLNYLITAYDAADVAYLAYHSAAANNTATQAQIDAVTAAQSNVNSALTQLSNAKAGK